MTTGYYLLFLRAGSPSSRETVPKSSPDLVCTSFCEPGLCSCPPRSSCPWPPPSLRKLPKFNSKQMTFCPEPSLPCSSGRLLAPAPASRVAQFGRDKADIVTPDLLFTSLLRAGSPSSRETAPILKHLTYYLRHFCGPGRPIRERQGQPSGPGIVPPEKSIIFPA